MGPHTGALLSRTINLVVTKGGGEACNSVSTCWVIILKYIYVYIYIYTYVLYYASWQFLIS